MTTEERKKALEILTERFGHDTIIALATASGSTPHVRSVDAYYENGAFYVMTHAASGKMLQLSSNPEAAVCGEWFTAHGRGENLGWVGKEANAEIFEKMKNAFSAWIDNGHSDLSDTNTVILKITLTDGVLASDGIWYVLEF